MQIKVGDLVRHRYFTKYGVGLVLDVGTIYAGIKWIKAEHGYRSQRVENLARVK